MVIDARSSLAVEVIGRRSWQFEYFELVPSYNRAGLTNLSRLLIRMFPDRDLRPYLNANLRVLL